MTQEQQDAALEEYMQREEVKMRNSMFQQLEDEQGIVWVWNSDGTTGHFRKLYRGVLGMDDHIQSGVNAKLLDIRKGVENMKRQHHMAVLVRTLPR